MRQGRSAFNAVRGSGKGGEGQDIRGEGRRKKSLIKRGRLINNYSYVTC